MALTADKLINDERFCGDNPVQFVLYLPFGFLLMVIRIVLAVVLWIASIVLPDKSTSRQLISSLACMTFGVHVKVKGHRDPKCSVLVGNYVSCLDSLATAKAFGCITLRKWKLPPFFASTLGIKNISQFNRKQHFAENPDKPVFLQPEGGPTNGKGLLKFTDWCLPLPNKVQPVTITIERAFTHATVHGAGGAGAAGAAGGAGGDPARRLAWRDVVWFLCSPRSRVTVRALPPVERLESDAQFAAAVRTAIADALQVEATELSWEDLLQAVPTRAPSVASAPPDRTRLARQVKEVLPHVPINDIMRDLAKTRSVDVTITNFLEGITPYTPESTPDPQPSTSSTPPKYITPPPTGTFPKTAKERQMSFQERKAQMIAEARQRYIEKHGLHVASHC